MVSSSCSIDGCEGAVVRWFQWLLEKLPVFDKYGKWPQRRKTLSTCIISDLVLSFQSLWWSLQLWGAAATHLYPPEGEAARADREAHRHHAQDEGLGEFSSPSKFPLSPSHRLPHLPPPPLPISPSIPQSSLRSGHFTTLSRLFLKVFTEEVSKIRDRFCG